MVLVFYRIRTYVNILMKLSTHSHSSPEEQYSNDVHRILICTGRIRGSHPQWPYIANTLHLYQKWQYMHIQQLNAHIILSNCDLILVHSQWLKAYSVVYFPSRINMLKFGGCASLISCLLTVYTTGLIDYMQKSRGWTEYSRTQHVVHPTRDSRMYQQDLINSRRTLLTCQLWHSSLCATHWHHNSLMLIHMFATETDTRPDMIRQYIICW